MRWQHCRCRRTGWFATSGGWDRTWGTQHPDDPLVKAFGTDLASWLWYHKEIYDFHTGDFINKATHPYNANPAGWLLMLRPIGIDAINGIKNGTEGCTVPSGDCLRVISGLGTPLLWWFAAVALVVACVWWLAGRDWRFGVAVVHGDDGAARVQRVCCVGGGGRECGQEGERQNHFHRGFSRLWAGIQPSAIL